MDSTNDVRKAIEEKKRDWFRLTERRDEADIVLEITGPQLEPGRGARAGTMTTNMLAAAKALSNQDLLDRLVVLAGNERHASADLIAHLAALHERPSLYEGLGFGSLFDYCTAVLRLSEDATCSRTAVAGARRPFRNG